MHGRKVISTAAAPVHLAEGCDYWCRGGLGLALPGSLDVLLVPFLAMRAALALLVRSRRGPDVKHMELLVLKHELQGLP